MVQSEYIPLQVLFRLSVGIMFVRKRENKDSVSSNPIVKSPVMKKDTLDWSRLMNPVST